MKYAHINSYNKLLGWYDSDIHATIPEPKILVQDSQWQIAIDNGHNKVLSNGSTELFDFRTTDEVLVQTKNSKTQEIRGAFESACEAGIDIGGVIYQGGFDSAIKLDAAKRLAETAGLTEVTFYDISNMAHILTLADALVVIMTIANDFQIKLAHKQTLMNDISSAISPGAVEAITWGVI